LENPQKLEAKLGSFPVSSLGVVPDLVTGFESEPLWQWSVLFLRLGEHFFDLEALVWGHF